MPPSFLGAVLGKTATVQTPVPLVSRAASAFSGWRYNRGATSALGAMEAASVVFGIVDRLATSVSLVDWKLWQSAKSGKPEDRKEVTSHLALDILNSPNPFYSRQTLFEAAQQHQDHPQVHHEPRRDRKPHCVERADRKRFGHFSKAIRARFEAAVHGQRVEAERIVEQEGE